ncbi:hypothetical protein LLG46_00710 [bacterium]|nr:hypothetical protein [bacterium]
MDILDRIKLYLDFVCPHYVERDVGHNYSHIERIVSRLNALCDGLSGPLNTDRLCFLAAFHGLWPKIRDDSSFRAETIAFLQGLGWSDADVENGLTALERHLHSPQSPEEDIVHDANYIEVIGALGIAKAFTVGGARAQSYEQTIDIYTGNLHKVKFKTPAGKRMADEGRPFAKQFLEHLRRELQILP